MRKLTIVIFLWLTSLSVAAQSMGDSLCVSRCDTLCIPQDSICPLMKDTLVNAVLEAIPQEALSSDSISLEEICHVRDTLVEIVPIASEGETIISEAEAIESAQDSIGNVLPILGIETTDSTAINNPSESEITVNPLFTTDSTAQERIPDSTAIVKSTAQPVRSGKGRRRRLPTKSSATAPTTAQPQKEQAHKLQNTILQQQDSIARLNQQIDSLKDSLAATALNSPATIQKEQAPSPTFIDFVNKWWLPIVAILLALAAAIGALAFYRQMARRKEDEVNTEAEETGMETEKAVENALHAAEEKHQAAMQQAAMALAAAQKDAETQKEAAVKAENQKAEAQKEAERSLKEKEIALQEKENALKQKAAIEKELEAAQKEKAAAQSELGAAQKALESAKAELAQAATEIAQLKQQLKEKEQQLKEKEEQAQAAATKSASASALGTTGRGQQLYEQVKAAEAHIHQWSKSDVMEFENYYKSINAPFMEQLATTYSSLPANHRIYAILVEMGMTDRDIQKLMNISQTTIRSYRHRMRNKEVGGSNSADSKEA